MNHESRAAQSEPKLSLLLIDDDVELGELMQEFFDGAAFRSRPSTMGAGDWLKLTTGPTT